MCIRFFVFFVGVTPTPTHAGTRATLYPPRKSVATVNAFRASVWRHLDHSTLIIWRNFDHNALGKGLGGRAATRRWVGIILVNLVIRLLLLVEPLAVLCQYLLENN